MLKLLIIGATSSIAYETTKYFATEGASLFLVARNQEKLVTVQNDLRVRGAKQVEICVQDMNDLHQHDSIVQQATDSLGGLDAMLIAHGTLSNQAECEKSVEETMRELNTNFLSAVSLLTIVGNQFEKQRRGVIAVISSVAGDRGRSSNYIYGSGKAGLNAFLSGLRNRLSKSNVHVLTVKPGFVDTPMTAHLKKNFLYASPSDVGHTIYKAMKSGKNEIYTPFFWRYIMMIIQNIPEGIFKKMKL